MRTDPHLLRPIQEPLSGVSKLTKGSWSGPTKGRLVQTVRPIKEMVDWSV